MISGKRQPLFLIALLCLGVPLAACSGQGGSSAPRPDSAADSQSVAMQSAPASVPVSTPAQAALFDQTAFAEFVDYSGLGIFITGPFESPTELNTEAAEWGVHGFASFVLEHYYETNSLPPETDGASFGHYFPLEEYQSVLQEAFGFQSAYLPQRETRLEGYVMSLDGFGPTVSYVLDEGSIQLAGGEITARIDYTSHSGSRWQLEFLFQYQPQNRYCPYHFLRAEETQRLDVVPPDIEYESGARYVTTAELNLRYGPGTEYEPPVYLIPQGAEIYVMGRMSRGADDWVYVGYDMLTGWVNTQYIAPAG